MSKFQIHILCFVLLILSGTGKMHGQNLIPNPGFEELFTQLEYQWVQPQGPYYHYESAHEHLPDQPLSGKYENGLCMYNTEPNEYLHVKLLQPLEKGEKYRLEVNARLMRSKSTGAELQKYIGAYFGKEELTTHVPGDLYYEPQINLVLPDSNRYEWFQMVDTFTAKGGETRFTMGYFPDTQWMEHLEKKQEAFMAEIDDKYKMEQRKKEMAEDKSWLYMSPADQKKFLKEQKKKRKKNKGNNQQETYKARYGKKDSDIDYTRDLNTGPEIFGVRYYFDDLCLSRIPIDEIETMCSPENLPETIAAGKVINLRNVFFQTDSATLRAESVFQLEALLRLMTEYPAMVIEIRGYTDNVGNDDYNLALSSRRAKAVTTWLVDKGLDPARVSSVGFGEADPIETNETEAGRARNRRVTFLIEEM